MLEVCNVLLLRPKESCWHHAADASTATSACCDAMLPRLGLRGLLASLPELVTIATRLPVEGLGQRERSNLIQR
jgi:hypothetical protein